MTLDDDVFAKIQEEVRKSGKSYKEVVNELLRRALNFQRQIARTRQFKVRPRALGRRPGINYDNIGELLEQLEGPTHS